MSVIDKGKDLSGERDHIIILPGRRGRRKPQIRLPEASDTAF